MVAYEDLSGSATAEIEQRWLHLADQAHSGMDLSQGRLVQAVLADVGPAGRQRLLLTIHHLVVDPMSWTFILDDLHTAYTQLAASRPAELPPKTTSASAWSARLHEFAAGEGARAQADYWAGQLASWSLHHAQDPPPEQPGTFRNAEWDTVRMSAEQSTVLMHDVPVAFGVTVEDVLLTAVALAYCRVRGQVGLLIDVEGHGREELFDGVDLSRTVGFLSSVHPVEFAVPENADLAALLRDTAARRQAEPDRGVGYGIIAYLGAPETRRLFKARPPSPVIFSYVGWLPDPGGGLGSMSEAPGGAEIHPDFSRLYPVIVTAEIADGIVTTRINRRSAAHGGEQDCRLAAAYESVLADLSGYMRKRRRETASELPVQLPLGHSAAP
jgi:hypothetical protein